MICIKELPRDEADPDSSFGHITREYERMMKAAKGNGNIVKVYAIDAKLFEESKAMPRMAMQYCPNGDVWNYRRSLGSFTPKLKVVRRFCDQMSSALNHLHLDNLLYVDFKLENVFIDSNFDFKLGDFGSVIRIPAKKDYVRNKQLYSRTPDFTRMFFICQFNFNFLALAV